MLQASFLSLSYIRLLYINEPVLHKDIDLLKKQHQYIFLITDRDVELPGFKKQKRQSLFIDLAQGSKTILQKFKSNTRKEVRQTLRNPDLTFVSNDKKWKDIIRFYKQFEFARDWTPLPTKEIKNCIAFSAYYKKELIAVLLCYTHGQTIRLHRICSKRYQKDMADPHVRRYVGQASRRLVYEICQYGIAEGFQYFDLSGVNFDDPKKAGISRFKSSFGGELRDMYVYRFMTPPFAFIRKHASLLRRHIT